MAHTALENPTSKFPKPPFKRQTQPWPGLASKMEPRPDHGEKSYEGSGRLAGRKALISGGDSGMGRAAAIAYAREGADVAINYFPNEEPDAQEVIALIKAEGRIGLAIPGDLRDEKFCQQLVARTIEGLGGSPNSSAPRASASTPSRRGRSGLPCRSRAAHRLRSLSNSAATRRSAVPANRSSSPQSTFNSPRAMLASPTARSTAHPAARVRLKVAHLGLGSDSPRPGSSRLPVRASSTAAASAWATLTTSLWKAVSSSRCACEFAWGFM
jgi:short chain dehydrogenase